MSKIFSLLLPLDLCALITFLNIFPSLFFTDEAQNIKNKDTNAAQACFFLSKKAVSRWCLTGTPIQNGAMELFSLIHFMRMPPFNDFQHFKEKIADPLASSNATRSNWGMKVSVQPSFESLLFD